MSYGPGSKEWKCFGNVISSTEQFLDFCRPSDSWAMVWFNAGLKSSSGGGGAAGKGKHFQDSWRMFLNWYPWRRPGLTEVKLSFCCRRVCFTGLSYPGAILPATRVQGWWLYWALCSKSLSQVVFLSNFPGSLDTRHFRKYGKCFSWTSAGIWYTWIARPPHYSHSGNSNCRVTGKLSLVVGVSLSGTGCLLRTRVVWRRHWEWRLWPGCQVWIILAIK